MELGGLLVYDDTAAMGIEAEPRYFHLIFFPQGGGFLFFAGCASLSESLELVVWSPVVWIWIGAPGSCRR